MQRLTSLLVLAFAILVARPASADRLRDLTDVLGARDNQLVGYGVVIGLERTGDDVRAPFAQQSLRALLRRLGVQVDERQVRLRNVAAVLVTTNLPPFARSGGKLDVTVSSIGNASSLVGGVLVQTPLRGANRVTYAVAQGPLILGSFSVTGRSGSRLKEGSLLTARIPEGAIVEKAIPMVFAEKGKITLSLRAPDFAMAQRVADAINQKYGNGTAKPLDGGAIEVQAKGDFKKNPIGLIAELGEIEVAPVIAARVIINERTGTIVAGGDVRLLPVAIAQGGITITVAERPEVSQPGAAPVIGAAAGTTETVQRSELATEERADGMKFVPGAATLTEVAQALTSLGVTPRELASILQALRGAGALRAQVVVQ